VAKTFLGSTISSFCQRSGLRRYCSKRSVVHQSEQELVKLDSDEELILYTQISICSPLRDELEPEQSHLLECNLSGRIEESHLDTLKMHQKLMSNNSGTLNQQLKNAGV
jgi:hypothetical protein